MKHTKKKRLLAIVLCMILVLSTGIAAFANENVKVYLDESLKRFQTVFPAAGSSNSAIELTIPELEKYSNFLQWVDVCKGWQEPNTI